MRVLDEAGNSWCGPWVTVVCVNQSGGAKPAAHLLKYDSILGTFDAEIKAGGLSGTLDRR